MSRVLVRFDRIRAGLMAIPILAATQHCFGAEENFGCNQSASVEISNCLVQREAEILKELENSYSKAAIVAQERLKLVGENDAILKASQDDWKKFTLTQCELLGNLQGNGIWRRIIATQCRIKFALERKQFLDQLPVGG